LKGVSNPLRYRRNGEIANNYRLSALINVVAYGVPAVLIVLGFFAYLAGYGINAVSSNSGIMNTGIILIVLGVVFYLLEFFAKIFSAYYSNSY
jgi:hypothetical protein